VATVPCDLKLAGEIAAGDASSKSINPGEALAIMTGAPLPSGADGVVPVEFTQKTGPMHVMILQQPKSGKFIAPQGADCRAGEILLRSGELLGPAKLALAASVGASELEVFAAPTVGVLATGNEIVPLDASPSTVQIRNSNNIMLLSLMKRLNCEAHDLGIVRDDPLDIRAAIELGVAGNDVLLVSGGMSMGEYDFVPRILSDLGFDLRITKLRIKPGKPFVFATRGRKFVFGLPGNPVSGFCCTLRLASRLLTRLGGGVIREKWIHATLSTALPANGDREFYQPAIMHDNQLTPLHWKGSADLVTLARANALLVRTEHEPSKSPGDVAKALEIPS